MLLEMHPRFTYNTEVSLIFSASFTSARNFCKIFRGYLRYTAKAFI